MTEDDIKELDDDFRMVKKLKKNKVSVEFCCFVQRCLK